MSGVLCTSAARVPGAQEGASGLVASWVQPALVFPDVIVHPQPRHDVRPFDGGAVAAGADGAVADDPGRAADVQVGVFTEPHGVDVDMVR